MIAALGLETIHADRNSQEHLDQYEKYPHLTEKLPMTQYDTKSKTFFYIEGMQINVKVIKLQF